MVLPSIGHTINPPSPGKFADRAGLLSLKHPNTLLLKYIGIVHNLDESKVGEADESTITIDVDEEEVKFFAEMYESEKKKWTEEKKKADGEIKALQNQLKTKEDKLAKLESEVDDKKRKELEAQIKKLRDEVVELQKKVNPMLHQEHIFKAQITKLQFQLAFLTGELEAIIRVKVEVDILRGTYDKFMKDTWEQLEAEYKERLAKLELELTLLLNQQTSLEDVDAIKKLIEELKIKIAQLTTDHEELKLKCSELSVKIQTDEIEFRAKLSSREREIEWEIREMQRQQAKWEELKRCLIEERWEVQVYGKLLSPEVERMRMRHKSAGSAPAV